MESRESSRYAFDNGVFGLDERLEATARRRSTGFEFDDVSRGELFPFLACLGPGIFLWGRRRWCNGDVRKEDARAFNSLIGRLFRVEQVRDAKDRE
jgi:hypothetical protein